MMRLFLVLLCLTLASPAQATPSPLVQNMLTAASTQGLANTPEWLALLHYRPQVAGWNSESQADDATFFFAANGKTDPAAELAATIAALAEGDGQAVHPQCRFPARLQWLQRQGAPFDQIPVQNCPELEQWLQDLNTAQVTLVFASSYLNSPSSMFGHTFLRLDPPNLDQRNPILASTISYAADASEHDNELTFAYRGIFGGYPGITTVEPYYDKIRLYSQLENRDLWEYHLNLRPEEVDHLLRHAWEIKDKRFDYYFFDENCAYRILTLVDVARPGTDLISQVGTLRAIPSDTVRVVVANELVAKVNYRPSQATSLNNQIAQLSETERALAHAVFEERQTPDETILAQLSPQRQAAVLETAYAFTRYRSESDKLPREATAGLSYELLRARSRVKADAGLQPPAVPTVRDDQGHATGRLTLTGGRFDDRGFAQLSVRPAYHDLQDPTAGYRPGSQLQFLNAEVRSYPDDDELQLEQLNLVEILSLTPRSRFVQPLSWRAGFGADRQLLESGKRPLAPYVAGGAGVSYGFASHLLYAMIDGNLRIAKALPDGFQLAPGLSTGWSWQSDQWAWHLHAASRVFPEQDSDRQDRLGAQFDWHWQPGWSLTLEFARERTGDTYASTVQVGSRLYF